jgi:hypothetical protein
MFVPKMLHDERHGTNHSNKTKTNEEPRAANGMKQCSRYRQSDQSHT